MSDADTVAAEEAVNQLPISEAQTDDVKRLDIEDSHEETTVPLSALQKERKKRQEAEWKAQFLEDQQKKATVSNPETDDSYESLTKGEYRQKESASQEQLIRTIEERQWMKNHADKIEIINERLPELLKVKPHLAYAIANSLNRYEEGWELLKAFDPGMRQSGVRTVPRNNNREAPGSPNNAPKAAALNEATDLSKMTDKEFNEWRASKKRRQR